MTASPGGKTDRSAAELEGEISRLRAELREAHARISAMEASRFWKLRNRWWRLKGAISRLFRPALGPSFPREALAVAPPSPWPSEPPPLSTPVDVVVCVHDAFEEVRACLASFTAHTPATARLLLVDDGSGPETREFLSAFARERGAVLIRNDEARGYTRAANQGMRETSAPYVVLLNSDTLVTPLWLERLVACAQADESIGLVGPLSNAATYQSIPDFAGEGGDWARNRLPEGISPALFAALISGDAGPLHARLPFLNGFCLLLKRDVLTRVGLFDEEAFPRGYGEENDLALRARREGFTLALADDAYVAHEMGRSYGDERRRALSEAAGEALARKHGAAVVEEGAAFLRYDRVLTGIRARARELADRHALRERARAQHGGRSVLFVLPVRERGGGAGVVLSEARAMRRMGVDARVLNLSAFRADFTRSYPDPRVPLLFAEPGEIPAAASGVDAVVATANPSVAWIAPLAGAVRPPALGYYLQDFEPYFYPEGSEGYRTAWVSFTRAGNLVRFATTRWVQGEIERRVGVPCALLGHSFQVDVFRPFSSTPLPDPVRITAMIRPSSPRRAPEFTLAVLERVFARLGRRVEITLFGVEESDPAWRRIQPGFPHELAGVLDEAGLASLFNTTHVFADLSTYQALGLSAQEAMACGAAVVVPMAGGTSSFAAHEGNALIADTSSLEACVSAISRLAEDGVLRERLAERGMRDVVRFHPDRTAARMLDLLFGV